MALAESGDRVVLSTHLKKIELSAMYGSGLLRVCRVSFRWVRRLLPENINAKDAHGDAHDTFLGMDNVSLHDEGSGGAPCNAVTPTSAGGNYPSCDMNHLARAVSLYAATYRNFSSINLRVESKKVQSLLQ